MTQPKGRPELAPGKRRPNFTVSTTPETKEWIDSQDRSRGEVIDNLVRFWRSHQPKMEA